MTVKPVVPRQQANRDVDEAIAYYLAEASDRVVLGFMTLWSRHTSTLPGTRWVARRAMR